MERTLLYFITSIPAAILIFDTHTEFFYITTYFSLIGILKHSNFNSDWGFWGKFFIQSPAHHRIHHAVDPRYHNKNFATLFQFYDIIFKTAYNPTPSERDVLIGISGSNISNMTRMSFLNIWLHILVSFYLMAYKNIKNFYTRVKKACVIF